MPEYVTGFRLLWPKDVRIRLPNEQLGLDIKKALTSVFRCRESNEVITRLPAELSAIRIHGA
jgi:hypothetical protein